jgi:protein O-mannosyl-transferase
LALMSKPMLVTLPFVLMLLDYWPLKRWQKPLEEHAPYRPNKSGRLILEKIPFVCLTIASSTLTLWAQKKEGAVTSSDILPILTRSSNAIVSYGAYLEKILWPHDLAVFYPYEFSLPLWKVLISGFIIIVITVIVLYYIKKLPFLFVGWFWYLGTLIPVIGVIQVGEQAMADRYTYLPSIGITMMLAWGIPYLSLRGNTHKKILFTAAIASLALLAFLTWMQCGYWRNSIELFSHSLRITNNNYRAHNHIGMAMFAEGKFEEAIVHFSNAHRMTNYAKAYIYLNRGNAYNKLGQYQSALEDYNNAIRLKPDYAITYNSRATVYGQLNQYQRALDDYKNAIRLKPDYADAYNNRAIIYLIQGKNKLSCDDLQKACQLGNCKILEEAKGKGYCH